MNIRQTQDSLKVMLPGTIRNDDFQRNPALQCWNNIVTIQNNVATMLQRCVALKIVVAERIISYNITLNLETTEKFCVPYRGILAECFVYIVAH